MNKSTYDIIWSQFGASVDMLINVVSSCPDTYFETNKRFYYLAFHSIIFLDYYLTIPPSEFSPMLPFTQKEKVDRPADAVDDLIPDRIYSRRELVDYLNEIRSKGRRLIDSLGSDHTELRFTEGSGPDDMDYPVLEILLYNMRHTQHHVGQLNLFMRMDLEKHMEWSFRADDIRPGKK
jgi:hypothetical protein